MRTNEQLLNDVIAQIVDDVNNHDLTAIAELIEGISKDNLENFISEDLINISTGGLNELKND